MNRERFYHPDPQSPFMPVEFAGAAYRFGHSLVRERYRLNSAVGNQALPELFNFTGNVVPANWALNWNRFFEISPATAVNRARKIDPYTAPTMHVIPGSGLDLAVRNLLRGWTWQLPSGQAIAAAIGDAGLSADEILTGPDGQFCKEKPQLEIGGFQTDTPLWYYVLKEAQVRHGGERLGAVGSTIVAEVFCGLLAGDTDSYLAVDPGWKPTLPAAAPESFTMADLFRFLPPDAVNPQGNDTGPLP